MTFFSLFTPPVLLLWKCDNRDSSSQFVFVFKLNVQLIVISIVKLVSGLSFEHVWSLGRLVLVNPGGKSRHNRNCLQAEKQGSISTFSGQLLIIRILYLFVDSTIILISVPFFQCALNSQLKSLIYFVFNMTLKFQPKPNNDC